MKKARSTSTKKPTPPSSVKQLKGRTSGLASNMAGPKNVPKQRAKARPARKASTGRGY